MKKFIIILVSVVLFASCKNAMKNMSPAVSGKVNEILVIADKNVWDGQVGDSIRAWFQQDQEGLPQVEPLFDMLNLPELHFDKNIKGHRNILKVEISPSVDSASIQYMNSPWAKSQVYFKIKAPNNKEFMEIFEANKSRMLGVYTKAEKDRLVSIYKRTADSRIFNLFKKKYDILLYCPTGYYVNKDTTGFVWISSETTRDSKGICFFTEEYRDQNQFNDRVIIETVNEKLKQFIPGPLKGSYMSIDTDIRYTAVQYDYQGNYAIMIRGLWTVVNDFMAGPFVLNVVLDQEYNRIIYLMGYVYYPNENKRNMVKQVEAILNTMEINYEEPKKEK
ncbi:DUF4837 family protein [Sanguibacteroides justesenii]|uniref:DUF4837 family protein n=1 Tax=Sanguibacteroides justesenii TaxID=1547597 RepID=A0AB34QZZ7_9PORP|nr:DUF4837 family protein [Sanguibacteroides justesenii]KIO43009.1 hypothetical protein IE90_12330 [Sanguibacteroides justesenii]